MADVIPGAIWDRNDFGTLCEWRMLYRAVEVGVDRGEFAISFLHRCHNCQLYIGVDPYSVTVGYTEMPWDRNPDYTMACIRLERFGGKAKLIRNTSEVAAQALKASTSKLYNEQYDFCYIDAAHDKESVAQDMELWWPLLSARGILAGHDFAMKSGDHPGVAEAVHEFADKHGLTIHVTWRDDPSSWFLFKDGSVHPFSERSSHDP